MSKPIIKIMQKNVVNINNVNLWDFGVTSYYIINTAISPYSTAAV
jgi:hypothetical protein